MAYITDTWDEINRKCTEGLAESAYALGDLKTITLDWGSSTEEIDMEIIGFNHDDLSDGSGKAAITFFSKQLLKDYKAMSGTHANTGGWAGNYSLRSWCNNTLYFALPSDLKPLIKEVTKLSDGGQNSTSLVSTNDKCWFASPMEIASSWGITTLDGQGVRYEHTMTAPEGANTWRTKAKKGGSAHHWWLRSSTTNNYRWGFVGNTGWPSYDNASNKFGIAFGFCVGVVSNEPEEPTTIVYTIEHNTMTSFADQARRINGGTMDALTPAQMLEIFENAKVNGSLDGLENGYDVMFYGTDNTGVLFQSVLKGCGINKPVYKCSNWVDEDGTPVLFPFTPTEDTILYADISTQSALLYEHFNIIPEEYPYIIIELYNGQSNGSNIIAFAKTATITSGASKPSYTDVRMQNFGGASKYSYTIEQIVEYIINNITSLYSGSFSYSTYERKQFVNHSLDGITTTTWTQFE